MNKQKLLTALIVFALGLLGILSMLTMDIPLSPEVEALLKEKFTAEQIKMGTYQ